MSRIGKNIKLLIKALRDESIDEVFQNGLSRIGIISKNPETIVRERIINRLGKEKFELLTHHTVFNPNFYSTYYKDLSQYKNDKISLLEHWINHGYLERRVASPIFDINFYLDAYKDVNKYANGDTYKTIVHWVNHGIKEKRVGSFLFDQKFYADKNKDVRKYANGNPELYFEHWLKYGIREQRNSSPFVDVKHYINNLKQVNKKASIGMLAEIYKNGVNDNIDFTDSIIFQSWPKSNGDTRYEINYHHAKKYLLNKYSYFKKQEAKKYVSIDGSLSHFSNKVNIFLVAHVVSDNIYGSEKSFIDIVSNVDQAKYNVIVCLPRYNKKYVDIVSNFCYKIVYFSYKWWTVEKMINKTTVNIFKEIYQDHNIDLVHANTIMIHDPLVAAKELSIANIVHVREIISKDIDLINLYGLESKEIVALVKENSDLLIVNSQATKTEFELKDKTYLLYNTVESRYYEKRVNPRNENTIFKIGMLSSNMPKKGIDDFVGLAQEYYKIDPNVEFILAGEETKWVKNFKQEINENKIVANLKFPGYVSDPKSLLDTLNVVINFSHFAESFGRTVVEGMACGAIPIVYNYGALSELFTNGISGFKIEYKKWKLAIPYITKLVSNKAYFKDVQKNAILESRKFEPSNFADTLNSIYTEIVENEIITHYSQKGYESFDFESYADTISKDPIFTHRQENKLSIAYFVYHFPVPSETFVLNEIKFLKENGYDVKVYCKGTPYKDFRPDFEIESFIVKDFKELAKYFIDHKINVAHSIFTYPTVTDYLWPACAIAKVPFTFAAHAAGIFKYENAEKNKIAEIVDSELCLRVLVPGGFHKKYLIEKNVPESKIIINPQVIENDAYLGYSRTDYKKHKSICAIGRFVEKKGYKYLIKAAKILAEDGIKLNLYGYGDLESSYRDLIKEYDLNNVFLRGGLNGTTDIIKAFEENDLFIQPSVRASNGDMDGIPTILIEAMSFGIPVMTSDISSIPELVQNGVNGFFINQADPDDIALQIQKFYAASDLEIRTVISNAKDKVDSFFDIDSLMENNIRIWKGTSLDVVIVSYNNLPHLKEVLKRLLLFSKTKYKITIFDNNSESDVIEFLQKLNLLYPNIEVIFNDKNVFVGPGTNNAIANGNADYICYVCGKEGMAVKEGWERFVFDNFDKNPDVGLAGSLGYSPSYLFGRDYPRGIKPFNKFRSRQYVLDHPNDKMFHVQGGLFAMRRAMIDDIGGFSENVPHDYTDVEFTSYVESTKWRINEIPGILALYNKTEPGLHSRLDEDVFFTHPPQIEDLRLVDTIRLQNKGICNVCSTLNTKSFYACYTCNSSPCDRTIYRYFSSSVYSFRRLKAIYINPSKSLEKYWRKSFQGRVQGFNDVLKMIESKGHMENRTGTFDIALLQDLDEEKLNSTIFFNEIMRCLAPDGELVFASRYLNSIAFLDKVIKRFKDFGFYVDKNIVYSTHTSSFNNVNLLVFKKENLN